jgi:hypothetical protein
MGTLRSAEFAQMLQRPDPPPKPDRGEAADVHLSPAEIEEWLRLFEKR